MHESPAAGDLVSLYIYMLGSHALARETLYYKYARVCGFDLPTVRLRRPFFSKASGLGFLTVYIRD